MTARFATAGATAVGSGWGSVTGSSSTRGPRVACADGRTVRRIVPDAHAAAGDAGGAAGDAGGAAGDAGAGPLPGPEARRPDPDLHRVVDEHARHRPARRRQLR